MDIFTHEYFMNEALKQAKIAFEEGEIPVGAVIVSKNRIIARAYNQTEKLNDVTAHAEILAITAAENYLGAKYLVDCKLYTGHRSVKFTMAHQIPSGASINAIPTCFIPKPKSHPD